MATNYTFAQACAIINEGTNIEAITDIGRRYPALLHKVTQVTALAGDKFIDLMSFMPDYLTANKVNSAMKAAAGTTTTDAGDDESKNEETATETGETEGDIPDYDSMSGKQLWEILGKAGKRKLAKSTKKSDLVAACKAMHEAGTEAKEDTSEETKNETEAGSPYDDKSAMDLFKLCKQRGIKAVPKKPAKFYADLLTKADAEAKDSGDSEDDWDEDATEEPKEEAKSAKKPAKTGKAKTEASKAKAKEDDGDDDWDI